VPFSFIVIGDTGEGDASQQVLKDSLLRAASAEDVRFVVVSSDVVYPLTIHHWVNGGGGAYLSFGSALAWPGRPDVATWAYYPNQSSVVEKIHTYTPWWKWPAWVWTRHFGAWPSSAEWLSAMFDYNVAPFFQSFVVVTVEPAARQITIRPWGVHGPLTWKDFDRSPSLVPPGAGADAMVEWVIR
jgi:hypothetical protein